MKEEQKVELVPGSDESIVASRKATEELMLKLSGGPELKMTPGEVEKGTETPPVPVPEPSVQKTQVPDVDTEIATLNAQLAERDAKLADIDSRFKKANGDYGGTLEKQNNQLRELTEYVNQLRGHIDGLAKENETLKKTVTATAKVNMPSDLIDDDLRDLSPKGAKKLEEAFAAIIAKNAEVESRLSEIQQGNESTVRSAEFARQQAAALAVQRYNDQIVSIVPNAEKILGDESYLEFIRKPDEYGRVLGDSINYAVKQLNAQTVVASMLAWKKANEKEPGVEADKKAKLAGHSAPSPSAGARTETSKSPADEATKRTSRISAYEQKRSENTDALTKAEYEKYGVDLRAERDYRLAQNSGSR